MHVPPEGARRPATMPVQEVRRRAHSYYVSFTRAATCVIEPNDLKVIKALRDPDVPWVKISVRKALEVNSHHLVQQHPQNTDSVFLQEVLSWHQPF